MSAPFLMGKGMITYSLLQQSLDQRIDRETMEEATRGVASLGRADGALLHRDLFGIVVSNLPIEDALAFQRALQAAGYATEVVPDRELPTLSEGFTIQRIDVDDAGLAFTDAMGRVHRRGLEDWVFLAGGFLEKLDVRVEKKTQRVYQGRTVVIEVTHINREEKVLLFRLDFFFWKAPHRLSVILRDETVFFYQGVLQRRQRPESLLSAIKDLRERMPKERIGSGLFQEDLKPYYPSLAAYEEEIRWRFYRLAKP